MDGGDQYGDTGLRGICKRLMARSRGAGRTRPAAHATGAARRIFRAASHARSVPAAFSARKLA